MGRPLVILALAAAAGATPQAGDGLQSASSQSQTAEPNPGDQGHSPVDRQRLDKKKLTPAQRKLDSHLRDEIARRRNRVGPPLRAGLGLVEIDDDDRALVEIRARILTQLRRKIERLKGTVVSSSLQYRSMIAWVPILKLETLAEEATVSAIAPAPTSTTARPPGR